MFMSVAELIEMIDLEKDTEKLFRWYQNGYSRNLPEIMTAALRQAIRLKAEEFDLEDDFENAVFHALAGYEVALGIKNEERTAGTKALNLLKLLKYVLQQHQILDRNYKKVNNLLTYKDYLFPV